MFIGRKSELSALEEHYKSGKPELAIVWGRRRIGKTELIKQFLKRKRGAYFLCRRESCLDSLSRLAGEIAKGVGAFAPKIESAEAFAAFARDACRERFIIALDEFTYLAETDLSATSAWQAIWDEYLSKTKAFVIICGSSVAMMEREVMGAKSPLYGRRTCQFKMQPLSFRETSGFFPKASAVRCAELLYICDGIPLYAELLDGSRTAVANAVENVARKQARLYEEPELLLKAELRQTKVYRSVLRAIASGKATTNEIALAAKVPAGQVVPYLYALEELGLIRTMTPAGEEKPASKVTLREIADNFLGFYYRFIEPNQELVEMGDEQSLHKVISGGFPQYAGRRFEEVAGQLILEKAGFPVTSHGRWWNRKGEEIDMVALSEHTNDILFVEAKWKRLSKSERESCIRRLQAKATLVGWKKN